ncbi:MAG: NAD(P)/FAD-dependent oxidoreductase [Clostridia bacterium]|nr:NAD(P)/FAD-dependent oxidoreductase [Clostridia bacterium]
MANILIIGGGVAGLSAGIRAQLDGHRAVICEKLPAAGGNLTGWRRGDYRIDNCIHWLTGTNPSTPLYRMWETLGALGNGIDIHRGDSLYTCEWDGERLSLWRDLDRLERTMLAVSPTDEKEIRSLVRVIRAAQAFCGIGGKHRNKGWNPVLALRDVPLLLRYHRMSTGDLAARFEHPLLRAFLTDFISERFASLAFVFVAAHFCGDNADVPAGGSVAMAERMVERFRGLGGELLTGKEVMRVLHNGKRAHGVQFRDGSIAEADEIVVTLDPAVVFPRMVGLPMPKGLAARYRDKRLMRFSSWHCAFACDLPEVPFHGDFVIKPDPACQFRLGAPVLTVREFSHDPNAAPRGSTLLQTMTVCDEATCRRFIALRGDRDAYTRRKQYLAKWTERALAEQFPELDGHLSCIDVWTPATYERMIGSEIGSFMSFAFGAKVLPLRASARSGLSNVTLASQWLRAPGGLPFAAEAGMLAVRAITAKYRHASRREGKAETPAVLGTEEPIG